MSSRELTDWLTGYLEYAKNSESPISYHTWVGISMLAGTLQRKIYFKWGYETIYPNMYIVLVGASAKTRKGTAIEIGRSVISSSGIHFTSESVTREAVIRAMANAQDQYTDPTKNNKLRWQCALTTISEELSVFLGQNDVKFLADLTDWYDSRDTWTYETKGAGTDKIQGVCFNLLGATAPEWLQSILPTEAIGGGFTSRVIFIVEEAKGKTLDKPIITPESLRLHEKLKRDLERILNVSGEIVFSQEAEDMYRKWYLKSEADAAKGIMAIKDVRFAGYCDRRSTHLRKLAILLSLSRSDELIIQAEDFERAMSILTTAEIKMPGVFTGLGTSQYAAVTEKILLYIREKKRVPRSTLLRNFYLDVDSTSLKMIEEVLLQMKVIKIDRSGRAVNRDNDIIYEYCGP